MNTSRAVVLDASVVAKWHLQPEEYAQQAQALQRAFIEGDLTVVLPDHAQCEVANAITVACRRGRMTSDVAAAAIRDLLAWDFSFVSTDEVLEQAFALAQAYDCALYDALYLAVADRCHLDLITADLALLRKTEGKVSGIRWLATYEIV